MIPTKEHFKEWIFKNNMKSKKTKKKELSSEEMEWYHLDY